MIKAKYYNFIHRLLINSGILRFLIIVALIESIIMFLSYFTWDGMKLLNTIFATMFVLVAFKSFVRCKYYIEQVEFENEKVFITFYNFNRKLDKTEIDLSDIKIDLYQNKTGRSRSNRLEIKSKNNQIHHNFVLKQYEIGYWNKDNLRMLFNLIRERQDKLVEKII